MQCDMCDIWKESPKRDFDLKLFEDVLKDSAMKKIRNVSFTGGEPFMIADLTKYYQLTRKHLPKSYVNISTNGYYTNRIMEFLSTTDKMTTLTISYDGAKSHDSIRKTKGSRNALLETTTQLKNSFPDIDIALKFTLNKKNYKDLFETAKQAEESGVEFYFKQQESLNCHQTRSENKVDFALKDMDTESVNLQLRQILKSRMPGNKRYMKKFISKSRKNRKTCNWPKNKAFVGLDGKVWLCRKKECIGNISENHMAEIWRSEKKDSVIRQMTECKNTGCLSFSIR